MLSGGQVAGLIVAVFWAILVSFLAYILVKLARLVSETTKLVEDLGQRTEPLLDDMAETIAQANEQLGRVDLITRRLGSVTQNAAAVSTTMTSIVGGPIVKAAAFTYGVRKAIATRDGKR